MKKWIFSMVLASLFTVSVQAAEVPGKVHEELLLQTVDELGGDRPSRTAALWGQGLYMRNGAMQYAMMSNTQKKSYLPQLTQYNEYWVTGMSSPWIDAYAVEAVEKVNDFTARVTMSFQTMSSAGPGERLNAVLRVIREDGWWRIDDIVTDEALRPYMGTWRS